VEIIDAVKTLNGNKVLNMINLSVSRGSVTGLKGHNGSGKTMLLRAVAGLLKLDSGTINIDGKRLGRDISFPLNMGLIIENIGLWDFMSGFECLCMLAEINRKIKKKEVLEAIERVGLDPKDKRKIRKYSLGMKQRLGIAQAIMEKPDLLLLDEPTNAIDSEGIPLIYDILKSEKQRGATILLASHSNDDIKTLCDKTYVMNNGCLEVSPHE